VSNLKNNKPLAWMYSKQVNVGTIKNDIITRNVEKNKLEKVIDSLLKIG
jgi:hypothetical protein